jgi:hypothetical protein
MLGTFLIFWRRLLPARGRLGGMMACWVGLLALRMYQKIGLQEQDLAFGAHQWLKSRLTDSTIPETLERRDNRNPLDKACPSW